MPTAKRRKALHHARKAANRNRLDPIIKTSVNCVKKDNDKTNKLKSGKQDQIVKTVTQTLTSKSQIQTVQTDTSSVLNFSTLVKKHIPENAVVTEQRLNSLFFDLANAQKVEIGLDDLIPEQHQQDLLGSITLNQDLTNLSKSSPHTGLDHSGGIVWETSFLLTGYLLQQLFEQSFKFTSFLDIGAGCGLMGLGIAQGMSKLYQSSGCENQDFRVALTEQDSAYENMKRNCKEWKKSCQMESESRNVKVSTHIVDWTKPETYLKSNVNSESVSSDTNSTDFDKFDVIACTDVIFNVNLVDPLLNTLWSHAHKKSRVFILVQERCAKAHERFFGKEADVNGSNQLGQGGLAHAYFKSVEKIDYTMSLSPNLASSESHWFQKAAKELDCLLYKLEKPRKKPKTNKGKE